MSSDDEREDTINGRPERYYTSSYGSSGFNLIMPPEKPVYNPQSTGTVKTIDDASSIIFAPLIGLSDLIHGGTTLATSSVDSLLPKPIGDTLDDINEDIDVPRAALNDTLSHPASIITDPKAYAQYQKDNLNYLLWKSKHDFSDSADVIGQDVVYYGKKGISEAENVAGSVLPSFAEIAPYLGGIALVYIIANKK
jgi:hypothetical protein